MNKKLKLSRKLVNKAAAAYLCDQEEGDLYDAYLKLQEAQALNDGSQFASDYVNIWQPLEDMSVDMVLELIDASIENLQELSIPKFIQKMDWKLLREQKTQLLEDAENNNLDCYGIISVLDALQDYAVDECGIDEDLVFNLNSEV